LRHTLEAFATIFPRVSMKAWFKAAVEAIDPVTAFERPPPTSIHPVLQTFLRRRHGRFAAVR
jgi:hypothetical protein